MYAMLLSNYEMLTEIHTMEKCDFSQIYNFSNNLILCCVWIHHHGLATIFFKGDDFYRNIFGYIVGECLFQWELFSKTKFYP